MAVFRHILKISPQLRRYHTGTLLLNKSITGYERADTALKVATGGKIYRWLDAYEDFVGLTEVKNAQDQVTHVRFMTLMPEY